MRAITKQGTGGSYHLSQSHATPPQTPEQATSRWGSFGHKAQVLQSLIDQHIEKGWSLAHLAQIDLLPSAGKLNRFFSLTRQFYGPLAEQALAQHAPELL